jgi:uncharacterized protein
MRHVVRLVAHWALLAHIYISTAGFTLALLFGVTGLTLNHQNFGFGEPKVHTSEFTLDMNTLNAADQADVEQQVREKLTIQSPLTDYHDDPDQIEMTFAVPGARTVVTINRADGGVHVEKESRGFFGRLGDLHKGSDAGSVWFWTIDLAAVLLVISSITGMVTLVALRARRRSGFAVCALGALTVLAIYFIGVPK